jgi:hypothetical protein
MRRFPLSRPRPLGEYLGIEYKRPVAIGESRMRRRGRTMRRAHVHISTSWRYGFLKVVWSFAGLFASCTDARHMLCCSGSKKTPLGVKKKAEKT